MDNDNDTRDVQTIPVLIDSGPNLRSVMLMGRRIATMDVTQHPEFKFRKMLVEFLKAEGMFSDQAERAVTHLRLDFTTNADQHPDFVEFVKNFAHGLFNIHLACVEHFDNSAELFYAMVRDLSVIEIK